jgi:hypothetical protein
VSRGRSQGGDRRDLEVERPVLAGDVITVFHRDVQTVTVGINYLFNWQ